MRRIRLMQKKEAQVADITMPDAAVHSVQGCYEQCLFSCDEL